MVLTPSWHGPIQYQSLLHIHFIRRRDMAAEDFQPKTGRIGNKPGAKSQRYVNRVIRNMRMATQRRYGSKKSSFTGSRIGRGYSQGAVLSLRSFQPGRRRVIVKARFTSFRRGGMSAARAHLRYIQRDGVTPDGQRGELYGRDKDQVDGKAFFDKRRRPPSVPNNRCARGWG